MGGGGGGVEYKFSVQLRPKLNKKLNMICYTYRKSFGVRYKKAMIS